MNRKHEQFLDSLNSKQIYGLFQDFLADSGSWKGASCDPVTTVMVKVDVGLNGKEWPVFGTGTAICSSDDQYDFITGQNIAGVRCIKDFIRRHWKWFRRAACCNPNSLPYLWVAAAITAVEQRGNHVLAIGD